MRKIWKILAVGCLCMSFAGGITAHADVELSQNAVYTVKAQNDYSHIAVSQVTDYVNIREQATTDSPVVGKIYNNCAAVIEEMVEGEGGLWYRIRSGTVTGFIKAQYFITGEEAEKLAQSIGREFAMISTENLRLRAEPNTSSEILTHLSNGARYVVLGEEGDFFKVEVDAGLVGYIAKEYCSTEVEFDHAVSLEEERQKLAEDAQRKQEAADAIAALEQAMQAQAGASSGSGQGAGAPQQIIIAANPIESDNSQRTTAPELTVLPPQNAGSDGSASSAAPGPASQAVVSATRTAIVAYAKQFLGNPYVYGGTSLTNGTDCSGFTQSVFAHFGIATGRSSRDQAAKGREIEMSLAQPGDLLFYASGNYINHVALYIGDGKVIHASNSTTGIIISPYNYRTPCKAVSFLD